MAETAQPGPLNAHSADGVTRRDFLSMASTAFGAVGAAVVAWPLVDSMNPSADVLAAGAPIDIDISHIQPGQQITVLWRGRPTFILHRTPEELTALQAAPNLAQLRDPESAALQQPEYAKNAYRSVKPEFLVIIGICTHLGCIPMFKPEAGSVAADWEGGYFCPCHGSKYDLAGRVFSGVPAPLNLPVPPYTFVSDTVIRVGENPTGQQFDINSVEQM